MIPSLLSAVVRLHCDAARLKEDLSWSSTIDYFLHHLPQMIQRLLHIIGIVLNKQLSFRLKCILPPKQASENFPKHMAGLSRCNAQSLCTVDCSD